MMARYRRAMAMRPVNRIKHVVDSSQTLASATAIALPLADATDTPTLGATSSVETGCTINGIYLKAVVASNEAQVTGAIPNVYMYVMKNPGNNLVVPAANGVGADDNKRFVIHQEMVMIDNKVSGQPTVLFNGVIAIPKGYRRFGPDDRLTIVFLSPAINITICFQCHYKEFR